MKMVLDLQGVQSESRYRGIGRYSLSLAKAMARQADGHELYIALNHAFPETIDNVRDAFRDFVEPDHILVWQSLQPVAEFDPNNQWRTRAAELIREHYLQSLAPDIVHVSSLFEGYGDCSVTSIGRFSKDLPTAVTLYDLIPFLDQVHYLPNPAAKHWYFRKLDSLKRADLLMAISEAARQEALEVSELSADRVVTISTDADPNFRVISVSDSEAHTLFQRYGLMRDFVMYTGGIDHRKNIEGLIEAFALLPFAVRNAHHLVIVCRILDHDRLRLKRHCHRLGLKDNEIVFTDYVNDDDLLALYNLCKLFVFPSLHEGFGLPVLEAMRCGAPVIGSDRSSIPEVIGLTDALFDPASVHSIAEKMQQALTDEGFRQNLCEHGRIQAKKFSWDTSAKRALKAFEALNERKQKEQQIKVQVPGHKPRMAYVSPLPPERSGIADYSAELLPELARYYEIDMITDLAEITDPYLAMNFRRRPIYNFEQQADKYERILYHFGNFEFHSHMFPLLERYPGTVVLHDFFLSGILHYLEAILANPMVFRRQLYYAHGFSALQLWKKEGAKKAVWHYPCNKKILEQAQGVIVHSRHAIDLAKAWYGQVFEHDLVQVPLARRMPTESNRVAARKRLAIPENAFLVCTFGILGKIKLNDRLLEAWLPSALARDERCFLFFVGDGQGSSYEKSLRQTIGRSAYSDRIRITGYVEAEKFNDYLAAADVGVQLRSLSRGETSISVLDCMSHGLPTIVNVHGSFAELPDGVVCKLPDKFTDVELVKALEQLFSDKEYRDTLGLRGKDYVCKLHSPVLAARQYAEAIEEFAVHSQKAQQRRLLNKLSHMKGTRPSDYDLAKSAIAIAANQNTTGLKQIFVDVTEIVRDDLRTGIQHVVRSVLNNWFENPPDGFRVEPVYRTGGQPAYLYARRYACHYLGIDDVVELEDAPIFMSKGDIFLGLDFDPALDTDRRAFLREQSQRGLKIVFIVYDLLPLLNRKYFPPDSYNYHCEWVNTIASLSDGLVCISKSVADELCCYLNENQPGRKKDLNIGYFHLGADVLNSKPDKGFNKAASQVVELLKRHTVLLMVGTIEPRKGYVQALDAMEMLWAKGEELVLLIVGKHGWMVDLLIKRLRRHPENGKRLIWFENASDELLLKLYEVSTALLMASEGEGFGLPLIEAAQHGLPIIARDLPVFREVAGERAFYFSGNSGAELAGALSSWLDLYRQGKHPKSTGFSWLTWKQSTQQLLDVILNENWYQQWVPGCVERKNF